MLMYCYLAFPTHFCLTRVWERSTYISRNLLLMLSFSCPPRLTCRILSLAEFPVWPSRWQGQGWNMSAVKCTQVTRKSLCNLIHSDAKCSNSSFLPYALLRFFLKLLLDFSLLYSVSTLFWSLSVHLAVFAQAAVCLREILGVDLIICTEL